jgi:trimethylamine--corrinoid protein Co-methyltransferase
MIKSQREVIMIQSSFKENRSIQFRVLSDNAIWEIQRAAFDILEKTGCKVLHEGARKLLKEAGAVVKDEMVKVPEFIVRGCLETAPKGMTIFDREGNRAMEVEGRKSHYGTSTASPNTRDALTGEIHETRVEDIARGALVADALSNIDWVMPMGSSQDVPPLAADVYEFEAVVTHTIKPIVFIGYSPRGMEWVFEMAAEVAGGLDALRDRPFILSYPETITPLVFPDEVVGRMFVSADLFLPQICGPTQQPGATSPVTLAGTVALATAEALMNVTLAQLRRQGSPCFMAANVGGFDMSTSVICMGSPEMSLGLAAQAEVAQSFGLPTWGLAGATDAKVIDAQAGIESAFSILAQGLAGLNLIHDVGYMDRGMICSAEMLVMGDEVIGMAKRFIQGIRVTAETLARDVIEKVGPGGHFLEEDHTYEHFRKELWMPKLLTREPYDIWVERGSKDMGQRVAEKVREILETHQVPSLSDKTLAALERITLKAEKDLNARS